jgi:WD40 repeat protein
MANNDKTYPPLHQQTREVFNTALVQLCKIEGTKVTVYREKMSFKLYGANTRLENWFYRENQLTIKPPTFEDFRKIALHVAETRVPLYEPLNEKPLKTLPQSERLAMLENIGTADWVRKFLENALPAAQIEEILSAIGKKIVNVWPSPQAPLSYADMGKKLDELFSHLNGEKKPSFVTVVGGSGNGKTTLVKLACRDPRMWLRFTDGIMWVDCKRANTTSDLLGLLRSHIENLGGSSPGGEQPTEYTSKLRQTIGEQRRMLIVLDNVENFDVIDAFNVNLDHCARLVITQSNEIGTKADVFNVFVTEIEDEAAEKYLSKLPKGDDPGATAALKLLVKKLEGWALVLNIVKVYLFTQIRQDEESGAFRPFATHVGSFLHQSAKLDAVQKASGDRFAHFEHFVKASLNTLSDKAASLYQSMVIFAAGAAIPRGLICAFAKRLPNGAGSDREVEGWLSKMVDLKLLEHTSSIEPDGYTYQLHDFIHNYLANKAEDEQRRGWHRECLSAMLEHSNAQTWASVPETHTYIWDHLITHLIGAGDQGKLSEVLLDPEFMIKAFSLQGVGTYTEHVQRAVGDVSKANTLLKWAAWLGNFTDLLVRCQTVQDQIDTVWARTKHEPDLYTIHEAFGLRRSAPVLTPVDKLNDISLPTLKHTFPHPTTSSLIAITESRSGRWYAATSKDLSNRKSKKSEASPPSHAIYVWHSETGKRRATLGIEGMGTVEKLVAYPDGVRLATIGKDKTLRLWDVVSGHHIAPHGIPPAVALGLSEVRQELIIGQSAGILLICDSNTLAEKGQIDLPERKPVLSLAIHPNGTHVAAINHCDIILVDLSTRKITQTIPYDKRVFRVAFSPDGDRLVATSVGVVVVFDRVTGHQEVIEVSEGFLFAMAFSPNGKQMAVAGSDSRVYVIAEDAIERRIYPVGKHTNTVLDVAFTKQGDIISASGDGSFHRWQNESCTAYLPPPTHHQVWVRSASFNAAGTHVVSVDENGLAIVWDVQTRQPLHQTFRHKQDLAFGRFTTDDSAYAVCSLAGELNLFDANTSAQIRTFKTENSRIRDMVFGHTNPWLICGDRRGHVLVFNHSTGARLQKLSGHIGYITSLALSADDTVLVTGGRNSQLIVWDTATWQPSPWLRLESPRSPEAEPAWFYTLAFSPDNAFLASGTHDGWVYIWQFAEGNRFQLLHSLRVSPIQKGAILGLTFDPTGQTLLASSLDEKIRLFDVRSGELLTTFYSDSMVFDCEFHPHQQGLIVIATEHEVAWLSMAQ